MATRNGESQIEDSTYVVPPMPEPVTTSVPSCPKLDYGCSDATGSARATARRHSRSGACNIHATSHTTSRHVSKAERRLTRARHIRFWPGALGPLHSRERASNAERKFWVGRTQRPLPFRGQP